MNSKALRETIESIRRKPYPLADLIPRLLKTADELDRLTARNEQLLADATRYQGIRLAMIRDDQEFVAIAVGNIPDEDVEVTPEMVDAAFDLAIRTTEMKGVRHV